MTTTLPTYNDLARALAAQNLPAVTPREFERRAQDPQQAIALGNMSRTLGQAATTPAGRERLAAAHRYFSAMAAADPPSAPHEDDPQSEEQARMARNRARLAYINDRLKLVGIGPITHEQACALGRRENPEHVSNALELAPNDPAWQTWLTGAIADACAPEDPAPSRDDDARPSATGRDGEPNSPQHDRPLATAPTPASTDTRAARRGYVVPVVPDYDSKTCFGSKVAIQFERCATPDRDQNTVNLKAANAKGASVRGGVDWRNAIVLMLTPHEVQLTYAALLGWVAAFRSAGHGDDNQKWFEVSESTGQYAGAVRFQIGHGEDRWNATVTHVDVAQVLKVFANTLKDQLGDTFLPHVRRAADLYEKQRAARGAARPAAAA